MLQTIALSCKSLLGSHNIGDLRKNRKRTPFSWQILHGIFSLLVDSRQNMHFFMDWNRDQEGNYYIFLREKTDCKSVSTCSMEKIYFWLSVAVVGLSWHHILSAEREKERPKRKLFFVQNTLKRSSNKSPGNSWTQSQGLITFFRIFGILQNMYEMCGCRMHAFDGNIKLLYVFHL